MRTYLDSSLYLRTCFFVLILGQNVWRWHMPNDIDSFVFGNLLNSITETDDQQYGDDAAREKC